jgi:hypothetical protein
MKKIQLLQGKSPLIVAILFIAMTVAAITQQSPMVVQAPEPAAAAVATESEQAAPPTVAQPTRRAQQIADAAQPAATQSEVSVQKTSGALRYSDITQDPTNLIWFLSVDHWTQPATIFKNYVSIFFEDTTNIYQALQDSATIYGTDQSSAYTWQVSRNGVNWTTITGATTSGYQPGVWEMNYTIAPYFDEPFLLRNWEGDNILYYRRINNNTGQGSNVLKIMTDFQTTCAIRSSDLGHEFWITRAYNAPFGQEMVFSVTTTEPNTTVKLAREKVEYKVTPKIRLHFWADTKQAALTDLENYKNALVNAGLISANHFDQSTYNSHWGYGPDEDATQPGAVNAGKLMKNYVTAHPYYMGLSQADVTLGTLDWFNLKKYQETNLPTNHYFKFRGLGVPRFTKGNAYSLAAMHNAMGSTADFAYTNYGNVDLTNSWENLYSIPGIYGIFMDRLWNHPKYISPFKLALTGGTSDVENPDQTSFFASLFSFYNGPASIYYDSLRYVLTTDTLKPLTAAPSTSADAAAILASANYKNKNLELVTPPSKLATVATSHPFYSTVPGVHYGYAAFGYQNSYRDDYYSFVNYFTGNPTPIVPGNFVNYRGAPQYTNSAGPLPLAFDTVGYHGIYYSYNNVSYRLNAQEAPGGTDSILYLQRTIPGFDNDFDDRLSIFNRTISFLTQQDNFDASAWSLMDVFDDNFGLYAGRVRAPLTLNVSDLWTADKYYNNPPVSVSPAIAPFSMILNGGFSQLQAINWNNYDHTDRIETMNYDEYRKYPAVKSSFISGISCQTAGEAQQIADAFAQYVETLNSANVEKLIAFGSTKDITDNSYAYAPQVLTFYPYNYNEVQAFSTKYPDSKWQRHTKEHPFNPYYGRYYGYWFENLTTIDNTDTVEWFFAEPGMHTVSLDPNLLSNIIMSHQGVDTVDYKALNISAWADTVSPHETLISLYALSSVPDGSEASQVLPVEGLGTDYFITTYSSRFNSDGYYYDVANAGSNDPDRKIVTQTNHGGRMTFAILAAKDNTTVSVQLRQNGYDRTKTKSTPDTGYGLNIPYDPAKVPPVEVTTKTLQRGEVWYLGAQDPTGTYIKASENIAVFAMNEGEQQISTRDWHFEQLLPYNMGGKNYYVPQTNQGRVRIRVVAQEDNTAVQWRNSFPNPAVYASNEETMETMGNQPDVHPYEIAIPGNKNSGGYYPWVESNKDYAATKFVPAMADSMINSYPPSWNHNRTVSGITTRVRDFVPTSPSYQTYWDKANIVHPGYRGKQILNKGEWIELECRNAAGAYIQADKNVQVNGFMVAAPIAVEGGFSTDPVYGRFTIGGDYSQAWIPAVEQSVDSITIVPFTPNGADGNNIGNYYLMITARSSMRDYIRVVLGTDTMTLEEAFVTDAKGYFRHNDPAYGTVGDPLNTSLEWKIDTESRNACLSVWLYETAGAYDDKSQLNSYYTGPPIKFINLGNSNSRFTISSYGLGTRDSYWMIGGVGMKDQFFDVDIDNLAIAHTTSCDGAQKISIRFIEGMAMPVNRSIHWKINNEPIPSADDHISWTTDLLGMASQFIEGNGSLKPGEYYIEVSMIDHATGNEYCANKAFNIFACTEPCLILEGSVDSLAAPQPNMRTIPDEINRTFNRTYTVRVPEKQWLKNGQGSNFNGIALDTLVLPISRFRQIEHMFVKLDSVIKNDLTVIKPANPLLDSTKISLGVADTIRYHGQPIVLPRIATANDTLVTVAAYNSKMLGQIQPSYPNWWTLNGLLQNNSTGKPYAIEIAREKGFPSNQPAFIIPVQLTTGFPANTLTGANKLLPGAEYFFSVIYTGPNGVDIDGICDNNTACSDCSIPDTVKFRVVVVPDVVVWRPSNIASRVTEKQPLPASMLTAYNLDSIMLPITSPSALPDRQQGVYDEPNRSWHNDLNWKTSSDCSTWLRAFTPLPETHVITDPNLIFLHGDESPRLRALPVRTWNLEEGDHGKMKPGLEETPFIDFDYNFVPNAAREIYINQSDTAGVKSAQHSWALDGIRYDIVDKAEFATTAAQYGSATGDFDGPEMFYKRDTLIVMGSSDPLRYGWKLEDADYFSPITNEPYTWTWQTAAPYNTSTIQPDGIAKSDMENYGEYQTAFPSARIDSLIFVSPNALIMYNDKDSAQLKFEPTAGTINNEACFSLLGDFYVTLKMGDICLSPVYGVVTSASEYNDPASWRTGSVTDYNSRINTPGAYLYSENLSTVRVPEKIYELPATDKVVLPLAGLLKYPNKAITLTLTEVRPNNEAPEDAGLAEPGIQTYIDGGDPNVITGGVGGGLRIGGYNNAPQLRYRLHPNKPVFNANDPALFDAGGYFYFNGTIPPDWSSPTADGKLRSPYEQAALEISFQEIATTQHGTYNDGLYTPATIDVFDVHDGVKYLKAGWEYRFEMAYADGGITCRPGITIKVVPDIVVWRPCGADNLPPEGEPESGGSPPSFTLTGNDFNDFDDMIAADFNGWGSFFSAKAKYWDDEDYGWGQTDDWVSWDESGSTYLFDETWGNYCSCYTAANGFDYFLIDGQSPADFFGSCDPHDIVDYMFNNEAEAVPAVIIPSDQWNNDLNWRSIDCNGDTTYAYTPLPETHVIIAGGNMACDDCSDNTHPKLLADPWSKGQSEEEYHDYRDEINYTFNTAREAYINRSQGADIANPTLLPATTKLYYLEDQVITIYNQQPFAYNLPWSNTHYFGADHPELQPRFEWWRQDDPAFDPCNLTQKGFVVNVGSLPSSITESPAQPKQGDTIVIAQKFTHITPTQEDTVTYYVKAAQGGAPSNCTLGGYYVRASMSTKALCFDTVRIHACRKANETLPIYTWGVAGRMDTDGNDLIFLTDTGSYQRLYNSNPLLADCDTLLTLYYTESVHVDSILPEIRICATSDTVYTWRGQEIFNWDGTTLKRRGTTISYTPDVAFYDTVRTAIPHSEDLCLSCNSCDTAFIFKMTIFSDPLIIGSVASTIGSVGYLSATGGAGTWSSDNTAVATVTSSGQVTVTGTGTASIIFTTTQGCSDIYMVTGDPLIACLNDEIGDPQYICAATLPYVYGDSTITAYNTPCYYPSGTAENGCDSITPIIVVPQTVTETIYATINEGGSYPFEGSSYTTAGVYPHPGNPLTNVYGCDSLVYLDLTVIPDNHADTCQVTVGTMITIDAPSLTSPTNADPANIAHIEKYFEIGTLVAGTFTSEGVLTFPHTVVSGDIGKAIRYVVKIGSQIWYSPNFIVLATP